MEDLERTLQRLGYERVSLMLKEESRDFIKDWIPGSKAEDYVVACEITAVKPMAGTQKPVSAALVPPPSQSS